jgi:hypothetical protein
MEGMMSGLRVNMKTASERGKYFITLIKR